MARHEELFIAVITVLVCLVQESKADGNIPKPQIIQTPVASEIYRNEKITLDCSVPDDSSGLEYIWYKDATLFNSTQIYTIDSADPSHNGEYKCQVKRGNDTSELSDPRTLSVVEPPQPDLVLSGWTKVYPAEVVHLSCNIGASSSDWTYQWHRDGQKIASTEDSSFSMGSPQAGRYTCVGVHKQRGVKTKTSNGVDLSVYGSSPKPFLTQDSASGSVLYTKEQVTLKCKITEDSEGWTYLWYKGQDKTPRTNTGSHFNLSSVVPADSGEYRCQAERAGFKSEYSDSLSLEIKDVPQTKLELQSRWTKVFPSEVVHMKCDIQPPSPDWICKYYRDSQELNSGDCTMLSIPVSSTDSGVYTCEGVHQSRTLKTQPSNDIEVHVYDHRPKLLLSEDPSDPPIYTKEKARLTCQVKEDQEGWTYLWYKDGDQNTPVYQASEGTYTLSSAQPSDSGEYKCQVKRETFTSELSDSRALTIKDPPVPKLEQLSEWDKVFPTETVRMKCSISPPSSDWTYKWYRSQVELSSENADTLSMSSVGISHTGQYACQGVHKRHVETVLSDSISIHVHDHRPKPLLSEDPSDPPIYTKENVTLTCQVKEDQEGWTYLWYKDGDQNTPVDQASDSTYTMPSAQPSDSGEYKCQVKRESFTSELSDSRVLTIKDPPVPKLEQLSEWDKVFPTETVRMKCSISPPSSDWTYKWYRSQVQLSGENADTLSMSSVGISHTGQYACQGVHKRHVETVLSDSISIHVHGVLSKPAMSKEPMAPVIYTKETVTLSCQVMEESTGWQYVWFKDQNATPVSNTSGRSYIISSVVPLNSGQYQCRVQRGSLISGFSESLNLTVKEPPQPKLSLQSPWTKVFPSEEVILKCNIQLSSNDWSYDWYKDGLKQTRTIKNQFKIKSVDQSNNGSYTCRGIHKRQVITAHSSGITVYVYDDKAVPTLSQHPNYTSVYVEEQVTFMCEVEIDSTGWEYQWFKKNLQGPIPNTDPTTTNYTIKSASAKHEDEFWCRAQRGVYQSEPSGPIQIQVLSRPDTVLTLETDWADILTVDSLTLRCDVQVKDFEWNYTWYRDGNEMADISADIHVKSTKETYQSEYTCQGARLQRPTYSALSEAFIANNLVLKRKILLSISGCLVVGIVLIVLGCIILKVTRKPVKESKTAPDLFFTMAELKTRADIGSTADLCAAESVDKLKTTEKTESEEHPCLAEELLKEAKESQDDKETDGFISFKA